uniref:ODAD1 central coiled coil region domain-containing protein n=1 Tax=Eptatretus burgeri TaxID=7764 RepID=A0A8C4QTR2_EPTBU
MANGARSSARFTTMQGSDAACPTMQEKLRKLSKTVHMLEEEQKTFHDDTQNIIKKNHDKICFLRKDNQRVRRALVTTLQHADENAFERIIQGRPVEKATLKHKSKEMLRILENRLDKSSIKRQQAEHMSKLYLKKRVHLQKERLTFPVLLNSLEAHLLQQHAELVQLQAQTADAIQKRNLAETRLQHLQEKVGKAKQERVKVQMSFRDQIKKERIIFEHLDKQFLQRIEMQSQRNLAMLDDYQSSPFTVEQEKKKCTLDEATGCITKATGVSNVQDILQRTLIQEETNSNLEKIRQKNDEELQCVIQQREYLQKTFDQLKYSREVNDNESLGDMKTQLENVQKRLVCGKEAMAKSRTLLDSIKTGIEHLKDKLNSISLGEDVDLLENLDSTSDESVLELFSLVESKLKCLLEGVQEKDFEEISMLIEEDEFHTTLEGKQPFNNAQFQSASSKQQVDSLYVNQEIAKFNKSRAMLKKRSQKIIEEYKQKRIH